MHPVLGYYLEFAVYLAIICFSGKAIWNKIGADSAARKLHGWYVFWWSVGMFVAGAGILIPLTIGVEKRGLYADGPGFIFLFMGWFIGTIHGGIVLLVRRRQPTPPVT